MLIVLLLLIFRDKVIRVTPKSSDEVDFLSSLENRQDLEVGLRESRGQDAYVKRSGMPVGDAGQGCRTGMPVEDAGRGCRSGLPIGMSVGYARRKIRTKSHKKSLISWLTTIYTTRKIYVYSD